MSAGQAVEIEVDATGKDYSGQVTQIGGATGSVLSLFPPENATGNYVKVVQRVPVRIDVVGIARTGKYRSLNEPPRPFFYLPYRQGIWDLNLGICVRTVNDPAMLACALQREIHQLDPRVEVWATLPMTDYIQAAFVAPVLASRLLSWLGLVALTLAAMGVYGVMAYAVGQRTQEFGVRMALGADTGDVLGLIFREGLVLGVAGIAVGLVLAVAATRLMGGFLIGISPFDPATFVGGPVLLGAVTLLACWLPARRATRVDPMVALRSE